MRSLAAVLRSAEYRQEEQHCAYNTSSSSSFIAQPAWLRHTLQARCSCCCCTHQCTANQQPSTSPELLPISGLLSPAVRASAAASPHGCDCRSLHAAAAAASAQARCQCCQPPVSRQHPRISWIFHPVIHLRRVSQRRHHTLQRLPACILLWAGPSTRRRHIHLRLRRLLLLLLLLLASRPWVLVGLMLLP